MRFTTAVLASVGLAAVQGHPLTSREDAVGSGCRVSLSPTLDQPQNAASNILYSTLSKWTKSTNSLYFSSSYLDTRNTTKAPYSVMFKANMIPDYHTEDSIAAVLETWMGTYLVGGETPAKDDYVITKVTCA
ncbi:hypothetical protein F5B22DRAFT_642570 [Xylaria bambusicola]|uniref:uncharacterized protein n=1 Tax=Xylaria bambusicola TaxID=326684 RepID=UPI002008181B|nr:uncharacterized protein F5B22DRAFT_642570 [Xylaria bambusicola]KAI0525559.1 hypothetical protein F5B22DRAFT_642570 [Xylaria bambusicola]